MFVFQSALHNERFQLNYSRFNSTQLKINPLETNHLKECLEKHFYAGTLLNTNENLISLWAILSFFSLLFLPLSSPSNIQCNSLLVM